MLIYARISTEIPRVKLGRSSLLQQAINYGRNSQSSTIDKCYGVFFGDNVIEKKVQYLFRKLNSHGEWFELNPRLKRFIDENYFTDLKEFSRIERILKHYYKGLIFSNFVKKPESHKMTLKEFSDYHFSVLHYLYNNTADIECRNSLSAFKSFKSKTKRVTFNKKAECTSFKKDQTENFLIEQHHNNFFSNLTKEEREEYKRLHDRINHLNIR